jgi:hypothetical protein
VLIFGEGRVIELPSDAFDILELEKRVGCLIGLLHLEEGYFIRTIKRTSINEVSDEGNRSSVSSEEYERKSREIDEFISRLEDQSG